MNPHEAADSALGRARYASVAETRTAWASVATASAAVIAANAFDRLVFLAERIAMRKWGV